MTNAAKNGAWHQLRRLEAGRYVLIRATSDTRGHGTHSWARFRRQELIDLLARTE